MIAIGRVFTLSQTIVKKLHLLSKYIQKKTHLHIKLLIWIYYIENTDIRANNKPDKSEKHDRHILPKDPVILPQISRPKRYDFNEGRENQCQCRATESPHQGNNRA